MTTKMTTDNITSTTPFTTTEYIVPVIPQVDIIYFTIIVTCFLVGTTGNTLALRYFLTKTRDIATSIYIIISVVDITISVLILPVGLPYILWNRQGWLLEDSTAFCIVWGMLWYIFSTLTIFLVAMLSITRTIQIALPFRDLKKRIIIGVIMFYVLVLFVQSTIPMWVGKQYVFEYGSTTHCTWRNSILVKGTIAFHAYTQVIFFENYFPIFPILISCVLTIRSLKSSENSALNRANREVTITIILFTVLYMVCNFPPVVMHLITIISQTFTLNTDLHGWDKPYWYWFKFYMILLVPLNSALNPIVYLWRMKKMRESTQKMVKQCLATVRVGSPLVNMRKMSMTAVTKV